MEEQLLDWITFDPRIESAELVSEPEQEYVLVQVAEGHPQDWLPRRFGGYPVRPAE